MAEIKQPVQSNEQPVYQQPQGQQKPSYSAVTGTEEWSHDIFGCLDGGLESNDNLCLKATFCSCFVYGKQQERLRNPSLAGYERINNDCLIFGGVQACTGLGWLLIFLKRDELRKRYNIRGDSVTDCLFSAFCGCCALIQQEKEIVGRQVAEGSSQGYVQQGGMVAAPQ